MNILILHGPNLNLLGEREPEIYGTTTLFEINRELRAKAMNHHLAIFQVNHEGKIIDYIHRYRKWADSLIINPGAFTHYSYSLRDAIVSFRKPTIEVHLSDLDKREEFRRFSVLNGLENVFRIMGKGVAGYYQALERVTQK
jgi:3-dehydroquinate dehydratase-2